MAENGIDGGQTVRDPNGRFRTRGPGGPGRPRRAVEADYLRALTAIVTPERWQQMVDRAVENAIAGDPKARQWLGERLLGPARPGALTEVAAQELAGYDPVVDRASSLRMLAALTTDSWSRERT